MLRRHTRMTPGWLKAAAGRPRAFTLMEMVVGVGAVAIVAVGLAAIFDSVGKTVSGGRRVSVMNTYASLLESQLRRDFENMTRDGFLVIRNQWTDKDGSGQWNLPGDALSVSPDFAPVRAYRIDEIQFVVQGKFQSARQPLIPGVQAESNTAVVWVGHGQMAAMETTLDPVDNYKKRRPRVDDPNDTLRNNTPTELRLGLPGSNAPNPNEYPIDWTLLRHQTLLVSPDAAQSLPLPAATTVYGFVPTNNAGFHTVRNRPTQYYLQPAASSIFRCVGSLFPDMGPPETPSPDATLRYQGVGDGVYPVRSSGIVDIAYGSLDAIRNLANTASMTPEDVVSNAAVPVPMRTLVPRTATGSTVRVGGEPVDLVHAYLSDTLPTESRNEVTAQGRQDFGLNATQWGNRMRHEQTGADLLSSMSVTGVSPLESAIRRADQLVLSSAGFVPHCTDFVVDWSFGRFDDEGDVIWHGLPSINNDTVRPYPQVDGVDIGQAVHTVPLGSILVTGPALQMQNHIVTDRLIHGYQPGATDSCLTSYFGWTDPTFRPTAQQLTALGNSEEAATAVVPWAWPTMVRVTVTLVDPNDPTVESTFQYVFDLPKAPGPKYAP